MVKNYTADGIIKELKTYANPRNIEGMRRFGISGKNMLGGPSIPGLRRIAADICRAEKNVHKLAGELWRSGIHEARILAGMVDDPKFVTAAQMERWAKDFDSWDLCDQVCSNLFDKTPLAYEKAIEWSERQEEYVKRAGFVLMAALSVHDKKAPDDKLLKFFPLIKKGATDERNFVKKAVNWALRQIGKRNEQLRGKALALAKEIEQLNARPAWWVARDAIRELERCRIVEKKGKPC